MRLLSWLRDRSAAVKYFWQRGRRGWADQDNWHFDTYIARVIAEMLARSATYKYGVPASYEMDNPNIDERCAHWIAHLKELSEAFRAYAEYMESDACLTDVGSKHYDELLERMKPLLDYYFYALGD